MDVEHYLDAALDTARLAGAAALTYYRGAPAAERKVDGTWVTEADRAAETVARAVLGERFPDHNILGEEEGLTGATGGSPAPGAPTWIVDPIDGTNNFMAGIPVWATLVGLEVDGDYTVGVAHAPELGETYDAARGLGARMNGDAISVSDVGSLDEASVLTAGYPEFEEQGLAGFVTDLVRGAWRHRGFGDFWGHCLVARGAAEVMVEPVLSAWDVAALVPIVEEAGGRITTLDGAPAGDRRSCLTTNGALHDAVTALFRH